VAQPPGPIPIQVDAPGPALANPTSQALPSYPSATGYIPTHVAPRDPDYQSATALQTPPVSPTFPSYQPGATQQPTPSYPTLTSFPTAQAPQPAPAYPTLTSYPAAAAYDPTQAPPPNQVYPQAQTYDPAHTVGEAPTEKKSKKPLIITFSLLAVILIVAAFLIVPEVMRSTAYNQALSQYDQGNYSEALAGLNELGDYKDARFWAGVCGDYVTYEGAIESYDAGRFEEARQTFVSLRGSGIIDLDEWINKCDYALALALLGSGKYMEAFDAFNELGDYSDSAEKATESIYSHADVLFKEGNLEEAYYIFLGLSDYKDSEARAAKCVQPFPESGVLYSDPDFTHSSSYIEFESLEPNYAYFYKIYSDETLVATLFVNPDSSAWVYVTPGTYKIKEGTGDIWFGEDLAFGNKGWYKTLVFDSTGTDTVTIRNGEYLVLTINTEEGGNVSGRSEDPSSF